jgi:hypothetical protein
MASILMKQIWTLKTPNKKSKLTSYYCRQHCGITEIHNTTEEIT